MTRTCWPFHTGGTTPQRGQQDCVACADRIARNLDKLSQAGRVARCGDLTITVYGFSVVGEALEKEIFPAFEKDWKMKTGQKIEFNKSFGGSELITNQIISGARAELAILAIDRNAQRLRDQHATKSDWKWLPNGGILHTTPMVIVVRPGNPKKIKDFKYLRNREFD